MEKIKYIDAVHRKVVPKPREDSEKIPLNDPDFSRRILTRLDTDIPVSPEGTGGGIGNFLAW